MKLQLQPITFEEACEFIARHHRHHLPPVGWRFGVAANDGERVVGVAVLGRPVSRMIQNAEPYTVELTRLCTDGTRNAASFLLGAARRASFALGYKRLITYTLEEEGGVSLRAAGWREIGRAGGGSWNAPSRPRVDKAPTGQKMLWEAA
jgi:hypothetical protein